MTSTERLHLALSACTAANAQDAEGLCAVTHPEVRLLSVPGIVPGPEYTGHDGIRRFFKDAAAHHFAAEALVVRAEVVSSDVVLAAGELAYTLNGISEQVPAWVIYKFRDGQITAIETYLDEARALEMARS